MVLFTGGLLWCLFLWLSRDDADEEEKDGSNDASTISTEEPGPSPDRRADGGIPG